MDALFHAVARGASVDVHAHANRSIQAKILDTFFFKNRKYMFDRNYVFLCQKEGMGLYST